MDNHLFQFSEQPTDIPGLKFRPSIENLDDADWIPVGQQNGQEVHLQYKHDAIKQEFSDANKGVLGGIVKWLEVNGGCKTILEIGVNRSGQHSSTQFLLDLKAPETKYIGVDLRPELIASVYNPANNVFGLATNSSNYDLISSYVHDVSGGMTLDLLIIDGWHSINQVLEDWKFTRILRPGGYVLMHDTNFHPGPYCVYEAIDDIKFRKEKHLTDQELDWGVATAQKLPSP